MPHTSAWSETSPAGTDLASTIDNSVRSFKVDVRERMALEHVWNVDTTNDGKHTLLTLAPGNNASSIATRTAASLTGSNAQHVIDLAQTWNTTGTPSGIKLNITDTASNAASLLLDLQVGAAAKFTVKKGGEVTTGIWNGTIITGCKMTFTPVSGDETQLAAECAPHLVATDAVSCVAFQSSGGALNVNIAAIEVFKL